MSSIGAPCPSAALLLFVFRGFAPPPNKSNRSISDMIMIIIMMIIIMMMIIMIIIMIIMSL